MSVFWEALRTGVGFGRDYGLWWGFFAFVLVLIAFFRKQSNAAKIKQLSPEQQFKIQQRQNSIETGGCLIGGSLALIMTLVMLYFIIWGD